MAIFEKNYMILIEKNTVNKILSKGNIMACWQQSSHYRIDDKGGWGASIISVRSLPYLAG